MAKKHIKNELKPLPTKRQLSRHKRQQRIQHIIYICGAVFLALLIAFVGYGLWKEQIQPFHQPVAKINGTTYDMDYYVKSLNLYSRGQDETQTSTTADNLINIIEYNQAIVAAAPEFGISVNNDEITSTLKTLGFTDDKVHRDAVRASLLANKILEDHFDKEVPASIEQVNTQAMFLESADQAEKMRARLAAGDNFTALAMEDSLESVTKDNGGNLGWLPKGYTEMLLGNLGSSVLKDVPFTLKAGEISEPTFDGTVVKSLGYWVVQVTDNDTKKGNFARGILTGSRHDAEEIRGKIIAGEDFPTLVKNYSQDYTSASDNGDFGWTLEQGGIQNRLVLGLAMPLNVGAVSQPAADSTTRTVGGFWLVKAIDRDDNRKLDDNTRQQLKNGLFQKWIGDKMKSDLLETLIKADQKTWAINLVIKSRGGNQNGS